jgi:hypothetical protein
MEQYSEIRRVEDEIDGVVKDSTYAWITEGIELEREDEDEESLEADTPKPSTVVHNTTSATGESPETSADYGNETAQIDKPTTRPHRIIRPTYKIRAQG